MIFGICKSLLFFPLWRLSLLNLFTCFNKFPTPANMVGEGPNSPSHVHHRSSSCPMLPLTCGWDVFNSIRENRYLLVGAVVGGPGPTESHFDGRDKFHNNQPQLLINAPFQAVIAGLYQHELIKAGTFVDVKERDFRHIFKEVIGSSSFDYCAKLEPCENGGTWKLIKRFKKIALILRFIFSLKFDALHHDFKLPIFVSKLETLDFIAPAHLSFLGNDVKTDYLLISSSLTNGETVRQWTSFSPRNTTTINTNGWSKFNPQWHVM